MEHAKIMRHDMIDLSSSSSSSFCNLYGRDILLGTAKHSRAQPLHIGILVTEPMLNVCSFVFGMPLVH